MFNAIIVHFSIVQEVLERPYCFHALPANHCMNGTDAFTGETTVWIHQNTTSQLNLFMSINPLLRFQHTPPSSRQVEPAAVVTFTLLAKAQSTMQIAANFNMTILLTTRESESPLKEIAHRCFSGSGVPLLFPQYNFHNLGASSSDVQFMLCTWRIRVN